MRQRRDSAGFRVVEQAPNNHYLSIVGLEPPQWVEKALCSQTDPESFFPEKGGSTREAKKVCMSCSVRAECLVYALDNDERWGIWGGLSERERRKINKKKCKDCRVKIPAGRQLCGTCRDRHDREKQVRYQDRQGRAIA